MTTGVLSPLDTVHAFLDAMEAKDFDTALRYVTDDCEYTNIPLMTVNGPAGIREVLEPFFAPILEQEFVIRRQAVTDGVVFVERLDRHRFASGWAELAVTGVLEVEDGRIKVWREYFDSSSFLRLMELAG